MKRLGIFLLLCGTHAGWSSDIPADFRARIVYQSPEEWRLCVMSSHLDALEAGSFESPLVGNAPSSILEIAKILVSMPDEARGVRLPEDLVFSAINDYVLTPPKKAEREFDLSTNRWIEVSALDGREFRIIFLQRGPEHGLCSER